MACPFPGMDPYLENPAFWSDFHARFITYCCDELSAILPDAYEARINERVHLVQMSPEVVKLISPDVALSQAVAPFRSKPTSGGILLLEPATIPHEFLEEVHETRVEILHRADRSLVTVMELLSPTNKSGDGFIEYRAKRKAILRQQVHLVELDLLLGGQRPALSRPLPTGDYFAFLSRAERRPNCEVYGWSIRDPLPVIPIPLRSPDPDVALSLQTVFQIAYERGRYARSVNYRETPAVPLPDSDRSWALSRAANGNGAG